MEVQQAFASALKQARRASGLTQEDFSDVSSRTYISTLERGLKSPTIEKVDTLANAMGIHPLTLMALTYLTADKDSSMNKILQKVDIELNLILNK